MPQATYPQDMRPQDASGAEYKKFQDKLETSGEKLVRLKEMKLKVGTDKEEAGTFVEDHTRLYREFMTAAQEEYATANRRAMYDLEGMAASLFGEDAVDLDDYLTVVDKLTLEGLQRARDMRDNFRDAINHTSSNFEEVIRRLGAQRQWNEIQSRVTLCQHGDFGLMVRQERQDIQNMDDRVIAGALEVMLDSLVFEQGSERYKAQGLNSSFIYDQVRCVGYDTAPFASTVPVGDAMVSAWDILVWDKSNIVGLQRSNKPNSHAIVDNASNEAVTKIIKYSHMRKLWEDLNEIKDERLRSLYLRRVSGLVSGMCIDSDVVYKMLIQVGITHNEIINNKGLETTSRPDMLSRRHAIGGSALAGS